MNRLERFYRRHVIAILWLAMILIVMLGLAIERASRRDTERSIQQQVCAESEVFTNALIDIGPPSSTPEQQQRRQAATDAFERSVESGLGGHCDIHLHPAR